MVGKEIREARKVKRPYRSTFGLSLYLERNGEL